MNSLQFSDFIPRTPKISCFLHPKNNYTHLCLSSKCIKRCLCRQCLAEHQPDHSLISIKEAVENQFSDINKSINAHDSSLKQLHSLVIQKINSTQKDLNQMFDSLKSRIDDIFKNINESSNEYIYWAKIYLEKVVELNKVTDQEKLRGIVQVHKIIEELGETFNYVPQVTFQDFLNKLSSWSSSMDSISKILETAYVKKKYKFDGFCIEKEYGNNGHKSTNTRATTLCGNTGIFTFDSSDSRRAPLLICYPKQEAIVGSYHHSIDSNAILSLAWMDNKKVFITGSSTTLKCFYMLSMSKIKCLTSIKRFNGLSLIAIPKQEWVVSTGKYPHCKIFGIYKNRFKSLSSINHELKADEKCTDGAYVSSEHHLILCFNSMICIYDLNSKRFLQEINIGYECLTIQYLNKRKVLLLGLAGYRIDSYKYTGQGYLSFEKKIETKANKPCCIVTDEEESQILVASNETYLEYCEIEDKRTQELNLKFKIRINSMIYFKENRKIIGGGDGNFVFVLGIK